MEISQKPEFLKRLAETMAAYSKSLPEGALVRAWWDLLQPFPLNVVSMALVQYRDENGEFAPVPAGIAKRCKLMDGRPTADEAWAIALASRNEEDTVVWTDEIAEAYARCSPVIAMGDEVGARRSFIDSYNRLIAEARSACKPARWFPSLGWDAKKRDAALERAHVAGLLPALTVRALLPNYSGAGAENQPACPQGLGALKQELAKLQDGWAKAAERREAEVAAEREAVTRRKREIAERAANYEERT